MTMRPCGIRAAPALVLAAALGSGAAPAPAFEQAEPKVGFALRDTAGGEHALARYAGRIVVLEFWSFKCPSSLAYRDRMAALYEKYRGRGVVFLAVASNRNESPEEIARNAANLKIPYPVLLDTEGIAAERLGAVRTPSIFILDAAGVLRYRGAPDNNKAPGQAGREPYAEEAIEALLAGRPVPRPQTDEFGCTIRRSDR
jgi:thiol-disulfide isomerase/thioredoxin